MLIQPLTGQHDRRAFDCGRSELNDWLVKIARQHQDKGLSKTFVAVQETAPSVILGYYALTLWMRFSPRTESRRMHSRPGRDTTAVAGLGLGR
ncbi:hypothetical protein Thi970DRAFT_00850 [Thiorhodovibrio frisius]|uniref:Uncharacterized protein n=1 Tax=Thiorhodovibrio frisius TaxID=631362 RepID=H8YXL8_9GAMM|nr:hypothetical protein Thi970DRAFT_00850 [Thiorhodovibrio frisius]WPL23728.1 hypothetical protein Thiofri_03931 [Thiorhodovibrio frisius]